MQLFACLVPNNVPLWVIRSKSSHFTHFLPITSTSVTLSVPQVVGQSVVSVENQALVICLYFSSIISQRYRWSTNTQFHGEFKFMVI